LRFQNSLESEEIILRALAETRESTSSILRKLEEIKQLRLGTSSALDSSSLMIPQTPNSIDTVVETAGHISRNTEAMIGAAGFALRC
jgi:methyl-accepting chemotaxis protein